MNKTDLAWIELSRSALRHNLAVLRGLIGDTVRIAPCVKANAYGHGMEEVAKELVAMGTDWLTVQDVESAIRLRTEVGIQVPIMILGTILPAYYGVVAKEQFRIFISEPSVLAPLAEECRVQNTSLPIHLEIDTGMSRYGVLPSEVHSILEQINQYPEFQLEAVVTHFASAGGPEYNHHLSAQLESFAAVRRELEERGMHVPMYHAAKSSAAVMYSGTHHQLIRPGIMLYGSAGSQEVALALARQQLHLRPVLTLKSRVTLLKNLPAGTPISYDATYITERAERIAVIPIGYADGVNRLLSNHGQVLIRGQRAPIRGRVCMNVIMVDVSHIPDVQPDDEVVLLGSQGDLTIHADQVAALTQTIPYEVFTSLREGLPRYVLD